MLTRFDFLAAFQQADEAMNELRAEARRDFVAMFPLQARMEDPEYSIVDRHCESPKAPGTMKDGTVLTNQAYRQPWVERDGVKDPHGDSHEG